MSCVMMTQESDDEVDLEALRLAALKSRKPKYPRVNHCNLIPIVPVNLETTDFEKTKIKVERVSPTPEDNVAVSGNIKIKKESKENEEKESHFSESTLENDQDILSMDDKEEEDSLEKLIDQLEAEISGKAPIPTDKLLSSKNCSNKKSKKNKSNNSKINDDDEIELVQIKSGKEPGAIIEIRESTSPEPLPKENFGKRGSPELLRSPRRRSRSHSRSRSRSPFFRTVSPYRWSRSPRRSRSPYRRSRSPFWLPRRSRSLSRRSRSPFGRYRSPGRKRSPFPRFSRSRSRSFVRRRSSWSLSPRRRSKSPLLKDGLPPRRRNFNSPLSRGKRSFSPRDGSRSPRRRSRTPRRFSRNSPNRWSKSPFRRSRTPIRRTKSPMGWSQSKRSNRSKSPIGRGKSPGSNKSPLRKSLPRRSKSPNRRSSPKSSDRATSKPHSKSPIKRYGFSPRSRRRGSNDGKSFSTSPGSRRNRSPLRAVEKNKMNVNDKNDSHRIRNRNDKIHRSLSRENNRTFDRRNRQRNYKRFSPFRNKKSPDRLHKESNSPKGKEIDDKNREVSEQGEKETAAASVPPAPTDPVLEARRKKFETLGEVDPTVDKKISLKAIKESTENAEDDDDALTINLESNLWDESEESENDFESRFKSEDARRNRTVEANQNILSFRSLREGDGKKINFNKPLTDDNRRGRFAKSDRHDRWQQGRKNDRKKRRNHDGSRARSEVNDSDKNNSSSQNTNPKRSDWKPVVWLGKDKGKSLTVSKVVSATQAEVKSDQDKNSEKKPNEEKDKAGKDKTDFHEMDDFEKLISDFEKELEVDTSVVLQDTNVALSANEKDDKKSTIKKDQPEPKVESLVQKRTSHRLIRINEPFSNKEKKNTTSKNAIRLPEENERVTAPDPQPISDGPEDYIEDDDFVLEVSARRKQKNKEEEDSQSDLRAVLSRRRNERLTKVVPTQENMPTRLVQSAFQGLVSTKSKRQIQDIQEAEEFPSFDKPVKSSASEGRRVLLLQRDKNPSLQSVNLKPNTFVYQRFTRLTDRKKRKLHRPSDLIEDMQQEEEEEGFEAEEGKQSRRFRLKRNIKLSSQAFDQKLWSMTSAKRNIDDLHRNFLR